MSDILEKLIGVEKKAMELVSEAEMEAGRRKSAVRTEIGRLNTDRIREKALELDKLVQLRKEEMTRERGSENARYLAELQAHKMHREDFLGIVKPLLGIRK
jgi:hypothetical protein